MILLFVFFFFSSRRRHTRFKCDWSSDVCSSDLVLAASQGTMNNLTFGNDRYQYYETICGGAGAGDGFSGASAGSGERRVGEEGRSRWWPYHLKKKKKKNEMIGM